MTIEESQANQLIKIRLNFLKPFEDTATSQFDFKPEGEQTTVTWSMYGEKGFMEKAFHLFVDFDAMLGGDFEQGLNSLKKVVETPHAN